MAVRRENSPAEIRGSVSRRRNANFDLRRRVLCGPAQGKQSDRVFRAGETQILNCRDEFFVALRRRNANLTSGDASCVHIMWIHEESRPDERKSPRRYSETQKKKSGPRFRAGETQILTSGVAFSVALRSEKRGGQKFAPRPKRLYPYRKNPSVCHTVWGNMLQTGRRCTNGISNLGACGRGQLGLNDRGIFSNVKVKKDQRIPITSDSEGCGLYVKWYK